MDVIAVRCSTPGCLPFDVKRKVPIEGVTMTTVKCPDCEAQYRLSLERKPTIVAQALKSERVKRPRREECNACSHEPDCCNAFNDYGKCVPFVV